MSIYTKAASFILDSLWSKDDFRDYFYDLGTELADLGPLTQEVFEPTYVAFKNALDDNALMMLESQVTADLLSPLLKQENFRRMWDQWDKATRNHFIQEQSELHLAKLLIQVYDQQLDERYRQAYTNYLAGKETIHTRP